MHMPPPHGSESRQPGSRADPLKPPSHTPSFRRWCMRDVKDKYTPLVCTFFRPSCVQKTRLTNDSEVSSPSTRRVSAYVRVVVLGVLGVLSFGPKNTALSWVPSPTQKTVCPSHVLQYLGMPPHIPVCQRPLCVVCEGQSSCSTSHHTRTRPQPHQ